VVVRTGAAQPVMAAASAPATPVVGADDDQVALDGQERAMIEP
jgi:hypothetical protein